MSSITMSNETIHGIVRRVKRRSSPFLTETLVKLRIGTLWRSKASRGWRISLGVEKHWEPTFFRSSFRPPASGSYSLEEETDWNPYFIH